MTDSDLEDATTDTTWSLPLAWVAFLLFIMAALVIGGVTGLVQAFEGHRGPPLLFMLVWFAGLGWNLYWWLFRVAYRVELVGGTLQWRAPLAGGTMPVSAIDSVGRLFGTGTRACSAGVDTVR